MGHNARPFIGDTSILFTYHPIDVKTATQVVCPFPPYCKVMLQTVPYGTE